MLTASGRRGDDANPSEAPSYYIPFNRRQFALGAAVGTGQRRHPRPHHFGRHDFKTLPFVRLDVVFLRQEGEELIHVPAIGLHRLGRVPFAVLQK